MKLILMRHMEVNFSPDRFLGQKDVELSEEGIEHAKRLGKGLKNEKIDVIYSTALKRTMKTADIIAKAIGQKVRARLPELNEMNFGMLEGLTKNEAIKKYPEVMKKRYADMLNFKIPEGESYKDAGARALAAIKKIVKENNGKTVLIVTHCNIMRIVMSKLMGKSLKDVYKKRFEYGCMMMFEVNSNKFVLRDFINS